MEKLEQPQATGTMSLAAQNYSKPEDLNEKDRKKLEWSWILYDCGNSAFSMAITTALFPVFYGLVSGGKGMDLGYFNSLASVLIAIMSPILGTYADFKDKKKRFFTFFFVLGVAMTIFMAVLPVSQWIWLGVIYIFAEIGFSGSCIFYDAFLVDASTHKRMNIVSTRGFAYGYIASIIPFGICLAVVQMAGMDKLIGYQIGFVVTAVWWGLLTLPMLRHVKQCYYTEATANPVRDTFQRLASTFKRIRHHKTVFLFLLAYFFYIDGVDTIIRMVVPYAQSVFGKDSFDTFMLLGILLLIQIVAFPCALLYGKLADKFGALRMIRVGIVTYMISVCYAWFMRSIIDIFFLGMLVGSAQGGIQALSRSYFAKIIPKHEANEFFGFYNIFGKFAAIMGPFLMSFVSSVTGNTRVSIFAIIPLFVIGFIVSIILPKDKDVTEHEIEE